MRIVKQSLASLALPHLPIIERSHDVRAAMLVRSFSYDNRDGDGDGDGDENVITAIGLLSKTTIFYTCITLFCTFLCWPLLHDYDLKIPNFTFYEGRKQGDDEVIFLFLNLSAVPKKSTPGKFAYFRYFQQIGINATAFEKTLIHFKSDIFAALAVVDAKTPWCSKTMKRRPCWCSKPVLWELNCFLM